MRPIDLNLWTCWFRSDMESGTYLRSNSWPVKPIETICDCSVSLDWFAISLYGWFWQLHKILVVLRLAKQHMQGDLLGLNSISSFGLRTTDWSSVCFKFDLRQPIHIDHCTTDGPKWLLREDLICTSKVCVDRLVF